jgi:hypothetical protein
VNTLATCLLCIWVVNGISHVRPFGQFHKHRLSRLCWQRDAGVRNLQGLQDGVDDETLGLLIRYETTFLQVLIVLVFHDNVVSELVDKRVHAASDEMAFGCPKDGLHVVVVRFYGRVSVLPNLRKVSITCEPHIQLQHPLLLYIRPESLRSRHHGPNILETLRRPLRDSFHGIPRLF